VGTTALTPLPYPESTDQPFVHLDIKALAEATAESLFVAASAAPSHKAGRRWHNTSTGKTYISNGTGWARAQEGGFMLTETAANVAIAVAETTNASIASFVVPYAGRVQIAFEGFVYYGGSPGNFNHRLKANGTLLPNGETNIGLGSGTDRQHVHHEVIAQLTAGTYSIQATSVAWSGAGGIAYDPGKTFFMSAQFLGAAD
jgi:hypothetical protein